MKHRHSVRRGAFRFALVSCLSAFALFPTAEVLAHDHHAHGGGMQESTVSGQGEVKKIDLQNRRIVLAHGPIEALGWPAMTMPFGVTDPALLKSVQLGDQVEFDLEDAQTISAIRKRQKAK